MNKLEFKQFIREQVEKLDLTDPSLFSGSKQPKPKQNNISPDIFFKLHKYLSNKLDKIAIENGDRMSEFSYEYPTASSFWFDIKDKI